MPNLAAQVALSPPVAAFATAQIITASLATDDYTECPMCGEPIRAVAKRCKHCGEALDLVLRRAEEAERLAERLSDRGPVIVNTNVVVESPRRYTGSVGGAVAVEFLLGFFGIFGVGHFMNGNVGSGLLFMFGYWLLFAINLALMLVLIGFITLPLTWLCFIIISPLVVASTPPVYYH
jgi:TM2 domain-containing membrane protein YozV